MLLFKVRIALMDFVIGLDMLVLLSIWLTLRMSSRLKNTLPTLMHLLPPQHRLLRAPLPQKHLKRTRSLQMKMKNLKVTW
jgi:hypothetical protein